VLDPRTLSTADAWRYYSLVYRYRQFNKILERPDFDIFSFVHELELHQGFGDPTSLCELHVL
jgi:hypothetical protein